jgi:hypothetical protein
MSGENNDQATGSASPDRPGEPAAELATNASARDDGGAEAAPVGEDDEAALSRRRVRRTAKTEVVEGAAFPEQADEPRAPGWEAGAEAAPDRPRRPSHRRPGQRARAAPGSRRNVRYGPGHGRLLPVARSVARGPQPKACADRMARPAGQRRNAGDRTIVRQRRHRAPLHSNLRHPSATRLPQLAPLLRRRSLRSSRRRARTG